MNPGDLVKFRPLAMGASRRVFVFPTMSVDPLVRMSSGSWQETSSMIWIVVSNLPTWLYVVTPTSVGWVSKNGFEEV
jgi:hypothetical protein